MTTDTESKQQWTGRYKICNSGVYTLLAQLQATDGSDSVICMVDNISLMGARLVVVDDLPDHTEWSGTLSFGCEALEISCVNRWKSASRRSESFAGVEFAQPIPDEWMQKLADAELLERSVSVRQENQLGAAVRCAQTLSVSDASVVNLSNDGICLAAHRPFDAGEHILIEVFPESGRVQLEAIARWSQPHTDAFLSGCQFVDCNVPEELLTAAAATATAVQG